MLWKKPTLNLEYDCASADSPAKLGDGKCDLENNIEGCYDQGDCCETTCYNCNPIPHNEHCIDPRTPDQSLTECRDVGAFVEEANAFPYDAAAVPGWDCDTMHLNALEDLLELDRKYGTLQACADAGQTSDPKLNAVGNATLYKYLECDGHGEDWTPADQASTCPSGTVDTVIHVFAGALGPDISWKVDKTNCTGGNYAVNAHEYKMCCLHPGAAITCLDAEADGWHGAFIEVDGKHYCTGGSNTETLNVDEESGDNTPWYVYAGFVVFGVFILGTVFSCICCQKQQTSPEQQRLMGA